MKKQKKEDNLQRLKDLTFQHALQTGKVLEEKATTDLTEKEINQYNDALQKGIELNVRTYELRKILTRIDTDNVKDTAIPDNSTYRFYYYITLLANQTNNEEFKQFCERLKKKHEDLN